MKKTVEVRIQQYYRSVIFRLNRTCSTTDSTYSCSFLCSLFCCSSVTSMPLLKLFIGLNATWQVHLWGSVTHCVRWGSLPPWDGQIWSWPPQWKHAVAFELWKMMINDSPRDGIDQPFLILPNYLLLLLLFLIVIIHIICWLWTAAGRLLQGRFRHWAV